MLLVGRGAFGSTTLLLCAHILLPKCFTVQSCRAQWMSHQQRPQLYYKVLRDTRKLYDVTLLVVVWWVSPLELKYELGLMIQKFLLWNESWTSWVIEMINRIIFNVILTPNSYFNSNGPTIQTEQYVKSHSKEEKCMLLLVACRCNIYDNETMLWCERLTNPSSSLSHRPSPASLAAWHLHCQYSMRLHKKSSLASVS